MDKSLKVLSCVPQQRYLFADKLAWAEAQLKKHKPDVMILPQEYHGGIQSIFFAGRTDEKISYKPEEILDPYTLLSAQYDTGICVGAVIDCPDLRERRERIYVIDPKQGVTGFADKMTLPAYDHIDAKGKTKIWPETNMENRSMVFDIKGARVGILFCWEAFSSYIWHAMSRAQPDFVASMIKFGVNGWPQKAKDEDKQSIVTGFGFGDDGGWTERLHMAAKWDLACPIICSTNSWDLPNKAGALAGQILPWEEKETQGEYARPARSSTLWSSKSMGKGNIQEHVQVDQVDYLYWRLIRDHKFTLNAATEEWPSSEARNLTMAWKVKRMERAFVGIPKLMAPVGSKPVVKAIKPERGLFD